MTLPLNTQTDTPCSTTKPVLMFSGQGSQYPGMGKDLYENHALFRSTLTQCDRLLQAHLDRSLLDILYGPNKDDINQTRYAQPAIFAIEYALYVLWQSWGIRPAAFLGHSIGELTAACAAGLFSLEDGLSLVAARGRLMQSIEAAGSMVAVLADEARVRHYLTGYEASVSLASINSPSNVAISGAVGPVSEIVALMNRDGLKTIPLKVSHAFHSPLMDPILAAFERHAASVSFQPAATPLISNLTGCAAVADAMLNPQYWRDHIRQPVRFADAIAGLIASGHTLFLEIGAKPTLSSIAKQSPNSDACQFLPSLSATLPTWRVLSETFAALQAAGCQLDWNAIKASFDASAAAAITWPATIPPINAESLGAASFRHDHHLRYAYVAGAMYRGISSHALVVRLAKAGMLAYFGSGGVPLAELEAVITHIQRDLPGGEAWGMNLLSNLHDPRKEMATVDLFLQRGIRRVEAAAFMQMTEPLVKYRLHGLSTNAHGQVIAANKVMGKISRPEVAEAFMRPAPARLVEKLLAAGQVTAQQAELSRHIGMADDISVEADSAGHTDRRNLVVLLPSILRLRDNVQAELTYTTPIRIGAGGGIGTPEAAAAAFMLGADYLVTGSINQCSVEAGISDAVKDMLQAANIQDTAYTVSGDMFETGSTIQVLSKGVFFPARASKLYELWKTFPSLDAIDEKTRRQIQDKYFHLSFDEVYAQTCHYFREQPAQIEKAERDPKYKMALIFRWYFHHSLQLAMAGQSDGQVDYQVHCGPAMGAFNQWVKGSELENWRNRHADRIGSHLMQATAHYLQQRIALFIK